MKELKKHDNIEWKQTQQELIKLRSLAKNRDEILSELDSKTKSLRMAETNLTIVANELELTLKQNLNLE